MGIEPLKTDEKLEAPSRQERSMDDLMLAGCASFVLASLLTYGLGIWPFFAFAMSETFANLMLAGALGLLPALAFGAFAARRYGLAGACGFVGGAMALAVFLHLNMKRIVMAVLLEQGAQPQFPPVLVNLLPLFWLLLALGVALLAVPRRELPGGDD